MPPCMRFDFPPAVVDRTYILEHVCHAARANGVVRWTAWWTLRLRCRHGNWLHESRCLLIEARDVKRKAVAKHDVRAELDASLRFRRQFAFECQRCTSSNGCTAHKRLRRTNTATIATAHLDG